MQKRGQASPNDGDTLELTFAQVVAPAEVEERDDEEIFGAGTCTEAGQEGLSPLCSVGRRTLACRFAESFRKSIKHLIQEVYQGGIRAFL